MWTRSLNSSLRDTASAPRHQHIVHTPLRQRLARHPEAGAFVGFAAVFLLFAALTPQTFLSGRSAASILTSQAVPGIVALGVTMLMISGEFDLSVGSILGVASLVFLQLATQGLATPVAALAGILTGCVLGLVNGLLLVWTGIPSFIITLGTLLVYRAISLTAISGGRLVRWSDVSRTNPILQIPGGGMLLIVLVLVAALAWLAWELLQRPRGAAADPGSRRLRSVGGITCLCLIAMALGFTISRGLAPVTIDFFGLLNGRVDVGAASGNFRMSIGWWLLLALLFHILLTRTRYGIAVFATGGHPQAARAQGINVDRTRIINFVICGGLAALAGVIQVARLKSVDPLRGEGLELEVIAAVVIGGTLLKGGYGSIIGAVIGTALTGMLRTGLVLSGVPSNAFRGAIGALVIIAVIINTLVRRQR